MFFSECHINKRRSPPGPGHRYNRRMSNPSIPNSSVNLLIRMERQALSANPWATHQWVVSALLPEHAPADLDEDARVFGPFEVRLYHDEAEGYFLNTSSGDPRAFVMWRLGDGGLEGEPDVRFVTLSYNEAARLMDAQERVDTLPLPDPLRTWLEAYVAEHYKPEPKKRRVKASFLAPGERNKL